MKKSKLFLYICLAVAIVESILTLAQGNLNLPSWATYVNWGLLILAILFFILFLMYNQKGE